MHFISSPPVFITSWVELLTLTMVTGGVGAFIKKHNCHEQRCPRVSWHNDEKNHPVCKHHHPDHPKHNRFQGWIETRNAKS